MEEVPDLRIVSDELWNAVKGRQTAIRDSEGVTKARATRFWEQRRAQHLLSGLVYCGSCGSRLASVGRDYLACSAARGRGTCANHRGVRRAPLEQMILEGLRQRLMAPDMVEEFVTAYHEEVNRHRREETAARAGKERELAEVTRKLDKLIEALIEGYRTAGLQQRLEELEARKAALERELAADPPPPVRLHPNLAQVYRGQVERLHVALADPGLRDEALQILRGLIERVVIHPAGDSSAEDGLQVEIVGEIVKMIELGLNAKQAALPMEAACSVKVVAGARFGLCALFVAPCFDGQDSGAAGRTRIAFVSASSLSKRPAVSWTSGHYARTEPPQASARQAMLSARATGLTKLATPGVLGESLPSAIRTSQAIPGRQDRNTRKD